MINNKIPRKKVLVTLITVLAFITAAIFPAAIAFAQTGKAQINNKAPTIESVTLTPDNDSGLSGVQVNPTPDSTTTVSVSIQAKDLNGYNDISTVAVVVYKPDGTTVHVSSGNATLSTGNGTHSTWTYSFNMNFYDAPATGTSTYKVITTATDTLGATGNNSATPAVFNYNELIALSLNTNTIDFGVLDPGQTSTTQTVVGTNLGNVTLDINLSGTNLSYLTNSIAISRVDGALDSGFTAPTVLSASSQTVSTYDLAPGAASSKSVYFRLRVPSGDEQYLPAGTYQGTVSIVATKSS